jgi:diamine N-acetyltransferase
MRGAKTLLRPIEPMDIDQLYAWENDTDNWAVSGTLAPYSKMVLKNYLQDSVFDIHSTKQVRFIITTLDNLSIGTIDLFDYDPLHQRAGVGILIGESKYRKQGYANDALLSVINYTRLILQLKQVYANIGVNNAPSIKLFERHGFKLIGVKQHWVKTPTGFADEAMYQLLF